MRPAFHASSRLLAAASILFVCSAAYVASRPLFTTQVAGSVRIRDFVTPYTGARCFLRGCNPYDLEQIKIEFRAAGGTEADHAPWQWETPVYPPSSLFLLLPFAPFHFHTARALWFALSFALFCGAMVAVIYMTEPIHRVWVLLLCAFLLPSKYVAELLGTGQPSAAAIGLSTVAFVLLYKQRARSLAILLLGIGLALKPQVALVLFLFAFVRRETRKPVILSAVIAIGLMLLGGIWLTVLPGSRNWVPAYRSQIAASVAGGVNDPSWAFPHSKRMINLQADLAGFLSRPTSSAIAWITAGLLLAIWIRAYTRNPESELRTGQALAAITCIGLVPIYHRDYDLPILMLTFPALVALCARRSVTAIAILVLMLLLLLFPLPPAALYGHWGSKPGTARLIPNERLRILLLARQEPLIILCFALFFTAVYARHPAVPIDSHV